MRRGIFRLAADEVFGFSTEVTRIFCEVMVYKAEFSAEKSEILYHAVSKHFDDVPDIADEPEYEFRFKPNGRMEIARLPPESKK